ncbi:MAG TPA: hypothetical protein VL856_21240 [Acidimicrobiia bacterium]|nr:hypothetical protein [Acidimicrobiia bacterium]
MSTDGLPDQANLERRVSRLADERAALFDRAGAVFGLSGPDRDRLTAIERELDECFLLRRQARADRDARRFAGGGWPTGVTHRRKAP